MRKTILTLAILACFLQLAVASTDGEPKAVISTLQSQDLVIQIHPIKTLEPVFHSIEISRDYYFCSPCRAYRFSGFADRIIGGIYLENGMAPTVRNMHAVYGR